MDNQGKSTSYANHKKNIKFQLTKNNVQSLLDLAVSIPNEIQVKFTKKYGRLIDLMRVTVDESALSALCQYWNPNLRIFELPHLDTCPTIEEYECLLKMRVPCLTFVYHRSNFQDSEKKLLNLLKLEPKKTDLVACRETKGLKRKFLERRLDQLLQQGEWENFMQVYALAIYGLVLFPYLVDVIDQAAMEVFYKFEKLGANPVPAILTETFLTLQEWRQTSRGKVKCCSQLLYVWIMTHLFADRYMRHTYSPLRNFVTVKIGPKNISEWQEEFNQVKPETYGWRCPWYEGEALILRCGKFPNVPLIGPRGCVIYTPALVLNQLKFTQSEVAEDEMMGFAFFYQNSSIDSNTLEAFKHAWKDAFICGTDKLGKHIIARTTQYEAWREERTRGIAISTFTPVERKEPHSEGVLQERVKILEAQVKTMEEQRENDINTIEALQRTVRKRDHSIQLLEEQCVKICETSTKAKRAKTKGHGEEQTQEWKARLNEMEALLKEATLRRSRLEVKILGLEHEREVMENQLEALKHDLSLSHHHAEQGWNTAERCHNALNKAREEVEHLSAKVDFLERKAWDYAREIEEQEHWLGNWQSVAENLKDDRNAWRKKYQVLANNLIHFGTTWLGRYEDASYEAREDRQFKMPPKLDQFYKCCKKMARYLKSWRDDNYLEN